MADLPNDFWSGWIIVLTLVGFVALLSFVLGIYFSKHKAVHLNAAPTWDGDLQEGDSPAPLWWFWLILAMMVFSVGYLMLYPGLGSFAGALGWSQQSQLHEHQAHMAEQLNPERQRLLVATYAELGADIPAMESAARLFLDNCAACHGREGLGQLAMFPNLRDSDWLWGGDPEQIEHTIRNGRTAVMVSWLPILGAEKVEQLTSYVQALRKPEANDLPGQMLFNQFCIGCHGAEGMGNPLLGAPRLNDDIWLYGGSAADIHQSIGGGRNGQMPAFGERLNDLDIKLLVAWLLRQPG